ncbi:CocE/NonD family hydrolase [Massilia agri]|uniref:CocE/NonD family hydrolase n=1 Tax=Massilia agri TaxID=1886785 RepID=A0ABT2AMW1_9BURK|nr:CocE/NonD family hydrolase [Massilia agri]MCS0597572.1 CocE/NonD family hydrolase [Massilia agri]
MTDLARLMPHTCIAFALAATLGGIASPAAAQEAALETARTRPAQWTVSDVMIPMRDGVKLRTKIFVPANPKAALPILFLRTPYGIDDSAQAIESRYKELAEDGYIFAFQDIRGKFGSEGDFVMLRPARKAGDTRSLDEGTDAWDSIAWMLKNVPANNGRVGMLGNSYLGWTSVMASLEPHPALKAIAPMASPADMWLGDDFYHNGAFRLSYGFEYAYMMEAGKGNAQFAFDRYDTYTWYLGLGSLANVNRDIFRNRIATWNDFTAHPDYDAFWQRRAFAIDTAELKVPTLNVAGWWDQEDFYGPMKIYETLEQRDKRGLNYLVVGPWKHGGARVGPGDALGAIGFDSATAKYYRERIEIPWFAYHLKGQGKPDLPEALTFEAGSNRWRRWDTWPPKTGVEQRKLYFGAGRSLSFSAPKGDGEGFDSYVSDPAHPVPYRHRPIQATYFPGGSAWSTWLVEDQRFVDGRPDVLTWESAPLEADLTIAGKVTAKLFASTTGSDADWIVKLIDVYPEHVSGNWPMSGYQLMVSSEVFRGRYRQGFEQPAAIQAGAVLPYPFSLHTQNYTFRKGHRLMVQVQSSWFPLIDRNPQTFVPNIFSAKDSDFRPATHRIYRSARYPSHVTIPVVTPMQ